MTTLSKLRTVRSILLMTGLVVWLVLPALPKGRAVTSASTSNPPAKAQKKNGSGLDSERQAALERLLAQFKAGAQFSKEEALILVKFGEGGAISELEADVVISRALYDSYVAAKELTKEQEELLDRYSSFVARRSTDVADLKLQLYNKRVAAAAALPTPTAPLVIPPNDQCAGAEVIPGAGPFPFFTTTTLDVTDATSTGDPVALPSCQACVTAQVSRSIWYRFTPALAGTYTISACASDGTASTADDTVMAIYTSSTSACGGVFTQVPSACDDDGCVSPDALQSSIRNIVLTAGTNYFIVVWECDLVAPTGGNTAVQLRVTGLPPANDTCAGAIAFNVNIPVSGTTAAASNDYQLTGATCFTGVGQSSSTATGRDVVYSFTAPSAGNFSFRVTSYDANDGNLVLYASTSCPAATPGTPVNITCNNVSGPVFVASNRTSPSSSEELMCVPLTAGQQIFIFVDDSTPVATFAGSSFTIEANSCLRETEANNTPATANALGVPAFGIEGSVTPAADVDFYSLGAPAAGSRVFALIDSIASNLTDFDMRVTTTTDTLEFDDINADALFGGSGPAIGGTPVPAAVGSVFLRVNHNLPGAVAEPYRLYYAVQPPGANPLPSCPTTTTSASAEAEPNNTSGQANSAANNYFSGALLGPAPSTDLDVFSFSASVGQIVFLSLDLDPCRDNTPIDGQLELLDTNGSSVLVLVDDSGSTSSTTSGAGSLTSTTPTSPAESIAFRAPRTGTFFARVSIGTVSNTPIGAGDYLLSISVGGPTAAKFANDDASSVSAVRYNNGVSLRWRTGFEVDNLGFNVYRDEGGRRIRVNPQIVAGSALMVGASTAVGAGRSYAWFDGGAPDDDAQYWVEAIDLNGGSTWHGPVGISQSADKALGSLGHGQSLTLGQLGVSTPEQSRTTPVERKASVRTVSASGVLLQPAPGGQPAVKMSVVSEGLYRVTQPELVAAGFDTNADLRTIQLFVDGREQPINVTSNTGQFDSLAAIEFYGIGLESAVTRDHIYWLVSGLQAGKRIQQRPSPSSQAPAGSFPYTAELRQRTIYFSALNNGEKENFFGAVVARDPIDQVMTLRHVDLLATGDAMLEVALQGATTSPHRVDVQINGASAGTVVFNGQDAHVGRLPIQQSELKEGSNIVRLIARGGPSDISLVDYVRLTYSHTFVADSNRLKFDVPGNKALNVDGFTSAAIRVFDVTNPSSPSEILGTIKPGKAGYSVAFRVPGAGLRTLFATTTDAESTVASIAADQPSHWRQAANAADLVIFTRRNFFSALEPLSAHRQSQGFKVAVVDVEDAYDEFSFGNKTPQAIRDFLAYATSNWKVAPRFVLLAGDASFDAKNYLGFGDNDLVPTKLIGTQFLETASDDWLTDLNGDGLGDLAVGRLPFRSSKEATAIVRKIVEYDRAGRQEGALLVSDENDDGHDFEALSRELGAAIPANVRVDQINRGSDDVAAVRAKLISALNRGPQIVNYSGHGNADAWRDGLLTSDDAGSLINTSNLSLFVMMTCLNGYFHDAQFDSLGESLMKANGGAVAIWASSGMSMSGDQGVMDIELFKRLFDENGLTLGEAVLRAKAAVPNLDVRRTWILLGDPTMRIKPSR